MTAWTTRCPSRFRLMWWLAYVVVAVVASLSVSNEPEAIIVRVPLLAWAASRAVRGGRPAWMLLLWLHTGEALIVGTHGVAGLFLSDQRDPGLLVLSNLAIIGLLLLPQVRTCVRPPGLPASPTARHPVTRPQASEETAA